MLDVVIEIPAWSFTKQSLRDGRWVREFHSPLPSLFNYGAALGTQAEDGCPQDVVVLGPRLPAGTRLQVHAIAVVRFWDDGAQDDKTVAAREARSLSRWERLLLTIFFTVYAAYKRYRSRPCRFEGVTCK